MGALVSTTGQQLSKQEAAQLGRKERRIIEDKDRVIVPRTRKKVNLRQRNEQQLV